MPQINRQFSFLEAVVPFPAVPAGNYAEVLLRVADQLCSGSHCNELDEIPGARSTLAMDQTLSGDDQARVSQVREALAKIAASLSDGTDTSALSAARIALDGVELVMRGTLIRNREDELPGLMPSMVFLVVLPIVGQDRALGLSQRTAALVHDEIRRIDFH